MDNTSASSPQKEREEDTRIEINVTSDAAPRAPEYSEPEVVQLSSHVDVDNEDTVVTEIDLSLAPPQFEAIACRLPGAVEDINGMRNMHMACSSSMDDIPPPKPDYNAPPPYEVATQTTKLPTYEETLYDKALEDWHLGAPSQSFRSPRNQRVVLPINNEVTEDVDTSLLGTDFMFYIAFFVAFIFNWIGFLLLMCFCHTIASRYGALSGFGLSLAKWTFIVQHSTELASKDNSWLWWLIMTFGLIICIRAILQYLNIKRGWHMLSASHQERLLFFY